MKEIDLDFLKRKRIESKLTLTDMAETFGLKDASGYYRYETGETRLKADMLPVLANLFKCDIKNFYK